VSREGAVGLNPSAMGRNPAGAGWVQKGRAGGLHARSPRVQAQSINVR
jgi:hypothetical protein